MAKVSFDDKPAAQLHLSAIDSPAASGPPNPVLPRDPADLIISQRQGFCGQFLLAAVAGELLVTSSFLMSSK